MKILVVAGSLLFCQAVFGQYKFVSKADSLIYELYQLQGKNNAFFDDGQFPAQRGNRRVPDNTIFFNALISFTLKGLSNKLSPASATFIDSICNRIQPNYIHYQHASGQATYNFWRTKPAHFFPNSFVLSHLSCFHVPDDADCTAMIFLTDSSLTSQTHWLQQKLIEHANSSHLNINNTFKRFRRFKAYSTWFGKKMPIEFDICVQSNVLLFIFKNKLPLTLQDEQTLDLLHKQIVSGDYLKYAYYLSPSYKKKAIVLYHLSRLLENNSISQLNDCRAVIKNDIENELKKETEFMDKVLLSTALIRMKGTPLTVEWPASIEKELTKYTFFRANLFSSYARPSLKFITRSNLFDIRFYCKSYCLALLAEYEQLMAQRIQTTR
ncbi:MAG TPA: hypothetical protein VFF27_11110 [Bacteroidia bacterium]|jgi:hypothetical protein|nr:hypothetical protein [Bacteroidia bacterium]